MVISFVFYTYLCLIFVHIFLEKCPLLLKNSLLGDAKGHQISEHNYLLKGGRTQEVKTPPLTPTLN